MTHSPAVRSSAIDPGPARPPEKAMPSKWTALFLSVVATLASLAAVASVDASPDPWAAPRRTVNRFLPAEFESQEGVLIGWDRDDAGMQRAIADIIAAASDRVPFYVLVPSHSAEADAARQLRARGVPRTSVQFLKVPTDSVWTRDYGPLVVLTGDGGSNIVDSDYGHGDRMGDDLVPAALAPAFGMTTLRPPITADGGNIQTNGRGLGITTTALIEHNAERGYDQDHIARLMRDYYGIHDLVFLEPLTGEQTGHVDMFAVFTSSDTVVVGRYDPRDDPVNAALLDRNAERLSRVRTDHGPLRVVRIPMPPRTGKSWPTYTNVLFANGTLLVPHYGELDPHGHAIAASVFRRALPGWSIRGIDCTPLIAWGGAIHCVTMNLCRVQGNDVPADGSFDEPSPSDPYVRPSIRDDDERVDRRRRPGRIRPDHPRRFAPTPFASPSTAPLPSEEFNRGRHEPARLDHGTRIVEDDAPNESAEPEWYPYRRLREPDRESAADFSERRNTSIATDEVEWKPTRVAEVRDEMISPSQFTRDDSAFEPRRNRQEPTESAATRPIRSPMFVEDGPTSRRSFVSFGR